jgi:aminoglycoside phosphotransferase (APT) family kinase protein
MPNLIDTPRAIRAGEELDAAKLAAWLRAEVPGCDGDIEIAQFPSGYSNLTYFLRAGERELVLRRPPFGSKVKSAHDMGREFRVLRALHPVYPAAPKPLAYCDDPAVLGAPFYVMDRIRGVIVRSEKPADLVLTPALVRGACHAMVDNLAALHAIDYEAIGLGSLRKEGSYVERQVIGWIDRYKGSQTDEIPTFDQAAAWLREHYPADTGAVLVHNDYKFDNVILDPNDLTRIIGVLDWEMCTIGDPLMDLGTALGYWIEPEDPRVGVVQCYMTEEAGTISRREFAERYAEKTGRDVSNISFYYIFALIKLAVIIQQIYYRYRQGLTKDERFAPLIYVVAMLGQRAVECIESGKIGS